MANYNKVILVGNLTRDPQMSYLPSQTPVTEFGLAINRRWKGKDGEQREETCFVDCKCYARQAEVLNQYMSKGRPILVEGRLRFSSWEDKTGQKRNKLRVVVERFQFLGGRPAGAAAGPEAAQPPVPSAPPSAPPEPPIVPGDHDEPAPPANEARGGDDIPF